MRTAAACKSDKSLLAILDAGPISPAELAFLSQQQRKRALHFIDALIDLLDAIDPNSDLEPTTGFVILGEVDEAESDADLEPSLGAPEVEFSVMTKRIHGQGHVDQRRWAGGRNLAKADDPSDVSVEGSGQDWNWPGQVAWADGYQRQPGHGECEPVSEDAR